jgi:hypothetical protein
VEESEQRLGRSPTEEERRVPRQQRDTTLIYKECSRVDNLQSTVKEEHREAVEEGTPE